MVKRFALLFALLCACDTGTSRAPGPPPGGIVIPDASTGEGSTTGAPRLDLPSWPDLPADSSSGAGSTSAPTTGALDGPESTSSGDESTSTGPGGSTGDSSGSTGAASTSTSGSSTSISTGADSSTAEAPAVCGDGTCSASELEVECYAPGWCYGDCAEDPACLSDCPCSPEAEAAQGFCAGGIVCSATAPGGYCDPDGNGAFMDADFTRGHLEWKAKCL